MNIHGLYLYLKLVKLWNAYKVKSFEQKHFIESLQLKILESLINKMMNELVQFSFDRRLANKFFSPSMESSLFINSRIDVTQPARLKARRKFYCIASLSNQMAWNKFHGLNESSSSLTCYRCFPLLLLMMKCITQLWVALSFLINCVTESASRSRKSPQRDIDFNKNFSTFLI